MRGMEFFVGIVALACIEVAAGALLQDTTGLVTLNYEASEDGITLELIRGEKTTLRGTIGKGRNLQDVSCIGSSLCKLSDNEILSITPIQHGFNVTWVKDDPTEVFEDCYELDSGSTNWFGGPQRWHQVWPLEKMTIDGSEPYVIKKSDNFGVAERYWLNSNGVYIWLTDVTPLWVDQNNNNPGQVCFRAEAKSPYINRERVLLAYVIASMDDPKVAHLNAINSVLGAPEAHPGDKMIEEPIWTTWAKYKKPINDETVLEFGRTIRSHGYEGGQLEIDDSWETCYGSQQFTEEKFANIQNTVNTLHEDGWRVSLWIHPFVNDDCEENSAIGKRLGYFVHNPQNETNAVWWNSDYGHQIDFTKPAAAQWWSDRVKSIQETIGMDSFKFDAGEVDYVNQPGVYADAESSPNALTHSYIETCVQFGDFIEVRSSFRGQTYGKFIRMLDKDSVWGLENGLASLITTLLQLNMNGYVMVLPDMIGGNGYQVQPTADLIVRWTQANTFMPAMQFSFLPWDYIDDVEYDIEGIVKKCADLHTEFAPLIINAMERSISEGYPVNPPIWWVDPTDTVALSIDDEYLLGEEVLVAPVIVEGAVSRDIYLPKGQWRDGNDGEVYEGPTYLRDYYAPIEVLPYFIKQ
ncbi:myogenesis-regulating glycosidase [Dendroctonus ponderosae]|uniref:Glycoside hydrolase family 31 N-terminal domain-containing protein n=1 Tax=Dendroctonus ponderosae TaxID=77166 RepID=J3JUZ1_DENPD|nr:myogenesis-regulating glycosidase [Dendroctonus ponderosae]AEE62018.1 unknown [Dendroctonus ponderosae]KAH1028090.1 hypothetical protein HUJ05_001487 [Dendroctonus ponderosae]